MTDEKRSLSVLLSERGPLWSCQPHGASLLLGCFITSSAGASERLGWVSPNLIFRRALTLGGMALIVIALVFTPRLIYDVHSEALLSNSVSAGFLNLKQVGRVFHLTNGTKVPACTVSFTLGWVVKANETFTQTTAARSHFWFLNRGNKHNSITGNLIND